MVHLRLEGRRTSNSDGNEIVDCDADLGFAEQDRILEIMKAEPTLGIELTVPTSGTVANGDKATSTVSANLYGKRLTVNVPTGAEVELCEPSSHESIHLEQCRCRLPGLRNFRHRATRQTRGDAAVTLGATPKTTTPTTTVPTTTVPTTTVTVPGITQPNVVVIQIIPVIPVIPVIPGVPVSSGAPNVPAPAAEDSHFGTGRCYCLTLTAMSKHTVAVTECDVFE
ncbi:hypothetical protein [Rhodococcus sp. IEGM 1379]|uniref:hypothetical protein n=1 Tax=Rhodococcus sp. IEGM 1379 TaxID=3047086 RepID=UPI0024B647E9|nr:hypothetical protein [Rhodococcus sp. IEGM 1379]MDI9917203.1 hypothetical protein [Rhodococcus sp. IEGM 1379]